MVDNEKTNLSKLTMEYRDFVYKMIKRLRRKDYKCIHTVWDNALIILRTKFPNNDPVKILDILVNKKFIYRRPTKGGYLIYIYGEEPRKDFTKLVNEIDNLEI